jgi:3',5'-cyclic AMP phosphodiesterase CpdA
MSTILHISDLHLGKADAWERATDDKVGIVPAEENSRLAVLTASLDAVKRDLGQRGLPLSALVISGDLTSAHDQDGFDRFINLVEALGIAQAEATIVVPGNHDVDWSREPGTPEKYARFLACTRARGMRTPFCDGVDAPEGGAGDEPVLELDDCVLVSLNSANWCGVTVDDGGHGTRVHDIARVSEQQLGRLTEDLRDRDIESKVRLAVIHHHLLPVAEDEEVKEFESFTNLARLRAWLREHRFHAVLHGHKHQPTLTWDHVYDFSDMSRDAVRLLVLSAPSPSTWRAPVCRMLHIDEATGREAVRHAPRITVETVVAERPERPLASDTVAVPLGVTVPGRPACLAIDALTADAAYEQLVHALDVHGGPLHNVTCVVRQPESAEAPPSNFSVSEENHDARRWLDDAVAWWQHPTPALVASGDAAFNHGQRLHGHGGTLGELERAAAALGSTRALVLLTSNEELRGSDGAPAFVSIQLVLATDEHGLRLDCVGYFRKQDLTLWWPVNIAELRRIQSRVLDLGPIDKVRPGHLVTIAAEAIHDDVLPKLAGTAVDRSVDLRPHDLMRLAYRAAHGPASERDEINKDWAGVLRDIGDDKAFPSLGLRMLIEHLQVFRDVGGKHQVEGVIKALEALYDRADRAQRTSRTRSERTRFSSELFALAGDVLDAVDLAAGSLVAAEGN